MANYISSNQNRFYAAVEPVYGRVPEVASTNRFPAMHVEASQTIEPIRRLDKTGTRTYQGSNPQTRVKTSFQVKSYLSAWNGVGEPSYGALFRAACGADAFISPGSSVNSMVTPTEVVTNTPHGLTVGIGISWSNEIRFVTTIINPYTFFINAPFTQSPPAGALFGPAVTYRLAPALPSFSLFDYWDSQSPIDRLVTGCAVESMDVLVNGDYHDFQFAGPASDLLSAISFSAGASGLNTFPAEPALGNFNSIGVPGHLGQAWIGGPATEFYTLTEARVQLRNNIDLRKHEFGSIRPRAMVPGQRVVASSFSIFVQDDQQTLNLYRAATQRSPFSAMLQLGTQQGQLMGMYLPQVVAELPAYDDGATRLSWNFQNNVSQGTQDDELFIAFA